MINTEKEETMGSTSPSLEKVTESITETIAATSLRDILGAVSASKSGLKVPKPGEPGGVSKSAAAGPKSFYNYYILDNHFMVEKGIYKVLKNSIEKRINIMLTGPSGVGKTELINYIAKNLNLPLTILDMGTMTDPVMGLVGTHVIKVVDGKTTSEFKKSRFSEVIQHPGIVLLDEINRASLASSNLLFPCLDFRRELPMEYSFDDYSPIKVHPDCVFVATANTGTSYTGTHKMDKALIDRFLILDVETLSEQALKKLADHQYPDLKGPNIDTIISTFNSINKEYVECKLSFNLSMRHFKMICKLVQSEITIYDAFYCVCKGLGGKESAPAIEAMLNPIKNPAKASTDKKDPEPSVTL